MQIMPGRRGTDLRSYSGKPARPVLHHLRHEGLDKTVVRV